MMFLSRLYEISNLSYRRHTRETEGGKIFLSTASKLFMLCQYLLRKYLKKLYIGIDHYEISYR